MEKPIIEETYGSQNIRRQVVCDENGLVTSVTASKRFTTALQGFKAVFLPQGYPESVSEDYLSYQIWDTVQAFCSSITGALAAQAVLKGVGVGDKEATVLAATLTWLIKDGTGMVGRIVFAWMKGRYLDCDCKRWRLFADILNDAAIFIELLAPWFKSYFTPVVCMAGLCKSIVGVAGGATRSALTQHQARRNNMADVSAKDGSQETLVNLAALLCNLLLIPVVTGNHTLIWSLFFLFTFLHLFANYNAVTGVRMENFNEARLHIFMKKYLSSSVIQNVREVNLKEPVLWKTRRYLSLLFGSSSANLAKNINFLNQLKSVFANAQYMVNIDYKHKRVFVVFRDTAATKDFLQAAVFCEVLEYAVANAQKVDVGDLYLQNIIEATNHEDVISALAHTEKWMATHFNSLTQSLEAVGWDLKSSLFCIDEWRIITKKAIHKDL